MKKSLLCVLLLLFCPALYLSASPFKHEGIIGAPIENIRNINGYSHFFIPYNATIVEVGAYTGAGTEALAQSCPYAKIYAIEAHPRSYSALLERARPHQNIYPVNIAISTHDGTARLWGEGEEASLLPMRGRACVAVPCFTLDSWCARSAISKIDFLRLDAGGIEWQILQHSPEVLKRVIVIVIKTHNGPARNGIAPFKFVKNLLDREGFTLLCHFYEENGEGEATFVRKCYYESIFG